MAEFVDVLRQFDRMCKANAGCFNCPLHEPDGVSDRCSIGAFVNDSERIEREVMQWAAEHPEPVYETWYEFLRRNGIIPDVLEDCGDFYKSVGRWLVRTRIERDMAERLGAQPKEEG